MELTTIDELKMLSVISKGLKIPLLLEVRATFLGAHAVPDEFRNSRKKYN
jgi:hypothetical protein